MSQAVPRSRRLSALRFLGFLIVLILVEGFAVFLAINIFDGIVKFSPVPATPRVWVESSAFLMMLFSVVILLNYLQDSVEKTFTEFDFANLLILVVTGFIAFYLALVP